jgi:regulator of sigma E protease
MGTILTSIVGFVLALGILITVHELGHFSVARFFGIRVLRFSLGFGRPFFRWHDKLGTEYVLSCIPLGGYVALFGEKPAEISGSERLEAFCYKSVWVRMAVLAAGPAFNLILAVVAYWLMFVIGIASLAPILGNVPSGSIADLAGLRQHQEIVEIENKLTPSWEAISVALVGTLGDHKTISIKIREGKDQPLETKTLDLTSLDQKSGEGDLLKDLGLVPLDPTPATVGRVLPDQPAANAGLKVNDCIVSVNGHPIHSRMELNKYIQPRNGEVLKFELIRNGQAKFVEIQPTLHPLDNGKMVGFIGIEYTQPQKLPAEFLRIERFGPVEALGQAVKRTSHYTILTINMLRKMVMGSISVKHLSGPISIAQYAGQTVTIGIEYFLSFLAVISISLGVINLLPIPLLDGGHLMYCVWELLTGRPVSDHIQAFGIWIGGSLLLVVTALALYNDVMRF